MGRDEKRRFKPNKKQFWLARSPAIKEQENGTSTEQKNCDWAKSACQMDRD
jgi:hypothetical protein